MGLEAPADAPSHISEFYTGSTAWVSRKQWSATVEGSPSGIRTWLSTIRDQALGTGGPPRGTSAPGTLCPVRRTQE